LPPELELAVDAQQAALVAADEAELVRAEPQAGVRGGEADPLWVVDREPARDGHPGGPAGGEGARERHAELSEQGLAPAGHARRSRSRKIC
jgi:hypothetical protein